MTFKINSQIIGAVLRHEGRSIVFLRRTMGHWYLVVAEDSVNRTVLDGKKLNFMVSPKFVALPEQRDVDSVVAAAVAKGFECSYAQRVTTPNWVNKKIDAAVLAILSKMGHVPDSAYDISIEPVARMREP